MLGGGHQNKQRTRYTLKLIPGKQRHQAMTGIVNS